MRKWQILSRFGLVTMSWHATCSSLASAYAPGKGAGVSPEQIRISLRLQVFADYHIEEAKRTDSSLD